MEAGRTAGLSSEREALKHQFLQDTGLGHARREPLTGDASTRSYERLHLGDATTRILMDQPPVESTVCAPEATDQDRQALGYNALARLAGGRVDAFVAVASWLRMSSSVVAVLVLTCTVKPRISAACSQVLAMLLPSPTQATVLPARRCATRHAHLSGRSWKAKNCRRGEYGMTIFRGATM